MCQFEVKWHFWYSFFISGGGGGKVALVPVWGKLSLLHSFLCTVSAGCFTEVFSGRLMKSSPLKMPGQCDTVEFFDLWILASVNFWLNRSMSKALLKACLDIFHQKTNQIIVFGLAASRSGGTYLVTMVSLR